MIIKKGDSIVSIDVETTGLDPQKDRVIQLSIVRYRWDGKNLVPVFIMSDFVLPDGKVPKLTEEVSLCNGITEQILREKGVHSEKVFGFFKDYMTQLYKTTTTFFLASHNINFDIAFIKAELKRLKIGFQPKRLIDTLVWARDIPALRFKSRTLQSTLIHTIGEEVVKKEIKKIRSMIEGKKIKTFSFKKKRKGLAVKEDIEGFHDAVFDSLLVGIFIDNVLKDESVIEFLNSFKGVNEYMRWQTARQKEQEKELQNYLKKKENNQQAHALFVEALRKKDPKKLIKALDKFKFVGGKNEGKSLREIDDDTLDWILENVEENPVLTTMAEAEKKLRQRLKSKSRREKR